MLLLPVIAHEYFERATGEEYGLGIWQKLFLLGRMVLNNTRVPSASSFLYHVLMATRIMKVPRSVAGSVVECGAFMGGSTVNLTRRRGVWPEASRVRLVPGTPRTGA